MPVEDNVRLLAESAEIFVYGITEQWEYKIHKKWNLENLTFDSP
jgi:hypothetical protein